MPIDDLGVCVVLKPPSLFLLLAPYRPPVLQTEGDHDGDARERTNNDQNKELHRSSPRSDSSPDVMKGRGLRSS